MRKLSAIYGTSCESNWLGCALTVVLLFAVFGVATAVMMVFAHVRVILV